MNTPKAIELALAKMVRVYADIGSGILLRPWQSLDTEGAFDANTDKTLPCVDIRFAPEKHDDNQVTLSCSGVMAARTYFADDVTHQQASAIYEALHGIAVSIFRSFMGMDDSGLYTEFKTLVETNTENAIKVGGITLDDGVVPLDDGGENVIGVGFGVHFSYT